jgi:hypothetical protein
MLIIGCDFHTRYQQRVARTLSYAEGALSSGFEGGSWDWVLSSRSANA